MPVVKGITQPASATSRSMSETPTEPTIQASARQPAAKAAALRHVMGMHSFQRHSLELRVRA